MTLLKDVPPLEVAKFTHEQFPSGAQKFLNKSELLWII
jgi:hypothetical protein